MFSVTIPRCDIVTGHFTWQSAFTDKKWYWKSHLPHLLQIVGASLLFGFTICGCTTSPKSSKSDENWLRYDWNSNTMRIYPPLIQNDPLHQIRPFVTLSQGVTPWDSNTEHVQRYSPTLWHCYLSLHMSNWLLPTKNDIEHLICPSHWKWLGRVYYLVPLSVALQQAQIYLNPIRIDWDMIEIAKFCNFDPQISKYCHCCIILHW